MPHKVIPIGRFDAPTTPPPSTVASGTAILAFESCAAATLSYNFSGGSSANAVGTILLRRVGPVPAAARCDPVDLGSLTTSRRRFNAAFGKTSRQPPPP
jgi:hypothetical protein